MSQLYEVLGVLPDASHIEIKRAYRKLALQHHPDKVIDESQRETSEIRFKEVTAAYEILSDEEKRSRYDLSGDSAEDAQFYNGQGQGFEDDAFMNFFHNFASGPSANGNGMYESYDDGQNDRSKDVQIPLNVTMADCYNGRSFKFQSKRTVVCDRCEGSGWRRRNGHNVPPPQTECKSCNGRGSKQRIRRFAPGFATTETIECTTCSGKGKYATRPNSEKNQCKKCKGKGIITESKPLTVSIPRGCRHGDQIKLSGEADQEIGKSIAGDLIFIIQEGAECPEKVNLERSGYNLITHLSLSLAEAITGFDKILTKTLDGRILRLNVPPGKVIRPGNVIKVEQEGWPLNGHATKFGDLYVIVHIEFPPDNWFSEKSDLLQIRNVLPSEMKTANVVIDTDMSDDPGNTESITNMKIINGLPDFMENNCNDTKPRNASPNEAPNDFATPQCAQQ